MSNPEFAVTFQRIRYSLQKVICVNYDSEVGSRSQWPSAAILSLGLRVRIPPSAYIVHICLSLVSVFGCQVEASAMGRSLVQRSPTDCVFVNKCNQVKLTLIPMVILILQNITWPLLLLSTASTRSLFRVRHPEPEYSVLCSLVMITHRRNLERGFPTPQ